MDITKCIKADHDEIRALFAELDELAHDDRRTNDAMRVAVRLVCEVKIHSLAEERVVYETMRTASEPLAASAREGKYEHQALELLLDRLAVQRPGPELHAIAKVTREHFEHHARNEEEAAMLPALEQALCPADSLRLAHEFLHERRRIRPRIERAVGPAPAGTADGRNGFHISHHRR